MKDTPILFTPENAQKVHAGTKTQTRRIVKGEALDIINDLAGEDQSPLSFEYVKECERFDDDGGLPYLYTGLLISLEEYQEEGFIELPCPYGTVGDRLWVREALCSHNHFGTSLGMSPQIREGDGLRVWSYAGEMVDVESITGNIPSIHMPKWACRTWLELTAVRVERVQEIMEEDAKREGCSDRLACARSMFAELWNSINGQDSWKRNEWVWVLEYMRVQS